ncbi:MAG: hypothetical protein FWH56_09760 [Betaproteobacteria bacterium]|nr:hypothetical protein [Betaproteobacteria bacterium]
MHKFYLSLLPEESRASYAEVFKPSLWNRKIGNYMMVFLFLFLVVFLIPEKVWEGLRPNIFYSTIYPQYIVHLLESNVIKQTSFPMSAYALWSIVPVFIIIQIVLFGAMLWPLHEFDRFLMRRKALKNKNVFWICVAIIVGYIGLLYTDGSHNLVSSVLKPYQYKLTYFFIYAAGAYVFSAAMGFLIADIRARLYLKRNILHEQHCN